MERFTLERMSKDTEMGWIGAFAILRDDTFLMSVIPSNHRKNDEAYLARSTDFGAAWSVERMELPISDRALAAGNGDLIELADGALLLTLDTWYYGESEDEDDLPVEQRGGFGYVLRSTDGGRTWPEKHCLSIQGGEVHLLELPSGTLLSAIRKQRNARLPGDPADIEVTMRANGYEPEYTGMPRPPRRKEPRSSSTSPSRVARRRPHVGQRTPRLGLRAVLRRPDAAGGRHHPGAHLRQPLPRALRTRGGAGASQLRCGRHLGAGRIPPGRRRELPRRDCRGRRRVDHDLPHWNQGPFRPCTGSRCRKEISR